MLRNASISFKLTVLMALASTVALLLASGGFLYFDQTAFRSSLLAGLKTQAQIMGSNCSAELAFKDSPAANETLSSLKAEEDVNAAALFTPNGKLFAKWGRTHVDLAHLPSKPQPDGVKSVGDHLSVFSTVRAGKDVVGVLYINSSLDSWHKRRRQYANIMGLLMIAGAALALVVGSRLQRIVSRPIQRLASSMRRVAKEQDYSYRVKAFAGGEIGELTSGFNSMLVDLEAHRNELRTSNEELETRVQQRTVELKQEIAERISAEKSLDESRQTLEEFFENASIGLMLLGPDGTILRANRMELETMGYAFDEYVGEDYFGFNTDPVAGRRLIELLANGQSLDTYETQIRCKDGGIKTIGLSCNALRNKRGEFVHARCFTRDITALKEAEAAERARLEAERASSAKSEFLSRMSHELRTPMNAILGFAQLLQMEDLEEEQQDSVGQIRSAGEHLLRLINEVLDISRIEAGALTISLEPVLLSDVAGEVKSLITPLAGQREITVRLELDLNDATHVLADRQRLCQVILNLVSNAVKYNKKGGSVVIGGSVLRDSRFRVSVTDTGAGIPTTRVHQIFQPFERLGAEETTIEGTGLGLALSKRLVEAMGGVISFDTSNDGTSFHVDLPLAASPLVLMEHVEAETTVENAVQSNRPRSVLLIEDNMSNVRLMEKILSGRPGVKLLVAMQGTLGYDLAVEHLPDLILLDLNLPDCHGLDVLKRLKALEETAEIPIVIVSADATQAQVARLLSAGAFKYLTKPLNVKELLRTLDEVLIEEVHKVA
jgi:PAS domain S-box-containing protein